jgi:outer membrane receptor for ferrienterochelin and colicin
MRGPQVTPYGRDATGVTINIISDLPKNEVAARAKLTRSNNNPNQ